ncbi:MAG: hypothetical protein EZS26_001506 [Candidatus Ordinivivax streblomastigis]|uniref:Uncharacterized protein n=1 Tax=Candidatus Ordinivivax streblomastigis TaxID=2540710 RepID=A0A5M8P1T1_9BACT|nr:MAG: hypothetical protein EZS26_001506 [Candidatus Ordinivivax streblomastigis]
MINCLHKKVQSHFETSYFFCFAGWKLAFDLSVFRDYAQQGIL